MSNNITKKVEGWDSYDETITHSLVTIVKFIYDNETNEFLNYEVVEIFLDGYTEEEHVEKTYICKDDNELKDCLMKQRNKSGEECLKQIFKDNNN